MRSSTVFQSADDKSASCQPRKAYQELARTAGAYCGEGGFFAQMAAMHAIGPYQIQNVDIDSHLVEIRTDRAPWAPLHDRADVRDAGAPHP